MQIIIVASVFIVTIAGMVTPGLAPPLGIPDSIAHSGAMLLCSLCVIHLSPNHYKSSFLIMLFFGVFIELAQFAIPTRTPELTDIASNLSGVLIAYALFPRPFHV